MNRRVLLVLFLFVLGSTWALPQPKLEVLQGTTLDFGKIFNVDKLTRNVTIKNTGTDTLHIKGVTAQCGCTTTGLSEKKIPPKTPPN